MDQTCSSRAAACSTRRCFPAPLVDQLTLITFPVMLGRGKRWYSGDPATARSWTLVEQAHSPKGVHFASFARGEEIAPAALPQTPRAKTNSRSDSVKRRVVGQPAALRPPIQQLHLEGADRAMGRRCPFKFHMLGPDHPENGDELRRRWPFGQFPLLVDNDRSVAEATCIIEHLQAHHPGPTAGSRTESSAGAFASSTACLTSA